VSTETRVFESVDNSPEAKAANAAYFAEQGITHEVQDDAAPASTDPATEKTPPATSAAPDEDAELDAIEEQLKQTAATTGQATTDGKRESSIAKARRERRELKAANEKLERELAELKAKPAETKPAETKPSEPAAAPAAAEPAATFAEPEPPEPKYEDFATSDDQLLAYQQALAKHTREWTRWDRKREAFETNAAAEAKRKTDQAAEQQNQRLTKLNERLTAVRTEHPDFDEVTKKGEVLSLALQAASTVLPDGLKLAYALAKDPAKLQQFNDLTKATQKVQGRDIPTQESYDLAMFLFGQMSGSTAPAAAPAAAAPPSSPQPREEPPAPRPARGRASDEPRREDLSGDARRDRLRQELAR
jgi:hypothetical protein